jgi:hypothetical protein
MRKARGIGQERAVTRWFGQVGPQVGWPDWRRAPIGPVRWNTEAHSGRPKRLTGDRKPRAQQGQHTQQPWPASSSRGLPPAAVACPQQPWWSAVRTFDSTGHIMPHSPIATGSETVSMVTLSNAALALRHGKVTAGAHEVQWPGRQVSQDKCAHRGQHARTSDQRARTGGSWPR